MTKCPATMCPYMGADESGSHWTGGRNTDCKTNCGWHHGGGCLVTGELIADLLHDHDGIPDGEWPACPRSDACQWQQELPAGTPCPPRLAVMLNKSPEQCLF